MNLILLMPLFTVSLTSVEDYWSEDFDSSKNCESSKDVKELEKGASQCQTKLIQDDDESAFLSCVQSLNQELVKMCGDSDVKEAGKLLYCKIRGTIQCCFKDHECDNWNAMNDKIFIKAKEYLVNTSGFLDHQVKRLGYKTCHHLNSLDATKCAKDCKKLKKEKFAKECEAKGGLFKCCIRRDKRFCHNCRFCCTLPMCSVNSSGKTGTTFEGENIELKNQKNKETAVGKYFSNLHRYKTDDYYCLKPDSNKDPQKWEQYDPEGYRKASTKEALQSVHTYTFDNRLNNFEDPKVLKMFTKTRKKSHKAWRETYAMWTRRIPVFYGKPEGINYR